LSPNAGHRHIGWCPDHHAAWKTWSKEAVAVTVKLESPFLLVVNLSEVGEWRDREERRKAGK